VAVQLIPSSYHPYVWPIPYTATVPIPMTKYRCFKERAEDFVRAFNAQYASVIVEFATDETSGA
jgi:hypothetical protein